MERAVALGVWCALVALYGGGGGVLPLEVGRLRAAVGGHAVMNCHLDFPFGHEIPYHLQWDKDGESFFSWYSGDAAPAVADRYGGRVRLARAPGLGRGSINVSAVRDTDAGLYRCRVTFPNRTPPARNDGVYYRLDVDGGDLIATPPTNLTVLEGDRAELECRPRSPGAPVLWLKDGAPLHALPALSARAVLADNGSLVLTRADGADAGEYACRVSDPDRPAADPQSAAAYLDVQYAAKVVHAPPERTLPLGKPASLDCHFSANPPLTNLRWEKDGFLFDPYNVPGVFYSRNGSLLFNQVDESHEGEYSCTPYNALGTAAGAAPRVRVTVVRAPSLSVRPHPLYLVRRGADVTMTCVPAHQHAGDAPLLTWTRRDGVPLPAGRHALHGGNLTISDVREEDAGRYACTVTNEAAALSADAELRVDGAPPRAPRLLRARARPTALSVTWSAAGPGADDDEYDVWYRETDAPDWRTMRVLTRGVTEATLLGLRPDTEYELRVLAQDHIGDGLFSRPLRARTPPDGAAVEADATEPPSPEAAAAEAPGADPERAPGAELQVSLRLVDAGVLVRWSGAAGAAGACDVRVTDDGRRTHRLTTHHDYALVGPVTEGAEVSARVECSRGAGAARLSVPSWTRVRGAAAAAAGALLVLSAAAALFVLRRRLLSLARR